MIKDALSSHCDMHPPFVFSLLTPQTPIYIHKTSERPTLVAATTLASCDPFSKACGQHFATERRLCWQLSLHGMNPQDRPNRLFLFTGSRAPPRLPLALQKTVSGEGTV